MTSPGAPGGKRVVYGGGYKATNNRKAYNTPRERATNNMRVYNLLYILLFLIVSLLITRSDQQQH